MTNAKLSRVGPCHIVFNSLPTGKFCNILLSSADISKSTFENYFRNTIRVSNSLDPDQARHYVGPDQGSNCLQKLPVDVTRRQIVKTV